MNYIPPIDAAAVLAPLATETADKNNDPLDLGEGYSPGAMGRVLGGVVNVTAADRTTEDEEYTFTLQESADGSTGWSNLDTLTVTEAGLFVLRGIVRRRFLRLTLDVAGTTPSVTYQAWLGVQ